MARKLSIKDPLAVRKFRGENQSKFWGRFSVTQSAGSRYESGRGIPAPTAMLAQLFLDGKITEADLAGVAKKVARR